MNVKIKEPKKIIRDLFVRHAKMRGNVVFAGKLFMINAVINSLFNNKDYRAIDNKTLIEYGELINKYLKNEVDLYWKDDKLFVEELTTVGEQSSGE